MMADEAYKPLVAFDSEDPQFVRGFEAGRVWMEIRCALAQRTLNGDETRFASCPGHDATLHSDNAEMVMRMAEATGHVAQAEFDGIWMHVTFRKPE